MSKRKIKWVSMMVIITMLTAVLSIVATPGNKVHAAPLRKVIDSTHPLMIMQLVSGYNTSFDPDFRRDYNRKQDIKQVWATIPDDVKPYVAFGFNYGSDTGQGTANIRKWLEDNLKESKDLNIPIVIYYSGQGGFPFLTNNGMNGWQYLEYLYQTYPNVIGTATGEQLIISDIPQLLALANTYGGYHFSGAQEADDAFGLKMQDAAFYNSVKQYSANFVLTPKVSHTNFDYVKAENMGDWLSNVAGNWGPYYDSYNWSPALNVFGSGYAGGDRYTRGVPETLYAQDMIDNYMNGATVFHIENQLDSPTPGSSSYSPLFFQSLLPALRYMIQNPAPTKAQVIANTKLVYSAVNGDMTQLSDNGTWGTTPEIAHLSDGLYLNAIDSTTSGSLAYYLRTSGRYKIIPQIPANAGSTILAQFPNVLTHDYYEAHLAGNIPAKQAYFNAIFPQNYTGDAFAENTGNIWEIYNSHYAKNINQTANIPLSGNTNFPEVDFVDFTPHAYAMLEDNGTSLTINLNNYRDDRSQDVFKNQGKRDFEFLDAYYRYSYLPHPVDTGLRKTTIKIKALAKPVLYISGYDGHYNYTESWDAANKVDTLTINSNGQVNIIVDKTINDANIWTRADDGSADISYTGTWTNTGTANDYSTTYKTADAANESAQYEFFGTSIQWLGRKDATGGTADVYIDGVIAAANVSTNNATTQYGVTLFTKSGLSNNNHTIKIVNKSGIIGLDRFSYIPAQLPYLNDVSFNDFSYADAASDQYGPNAAVAEHWVVKNGVMKMMPYNFPWNSEITVINNKQNYTDFTYEAKVNSLKGTPVRLVFRENPLTKASYSFMLDPLPKNPYNDGAAELKLYKDDKVLLGSSTALALNTNTAYSVKVDVTGSTIKCYINGTLYITATDTSYTSGKVGIRLDNNARVNGDFVLVDDVKVTVGGVVNYTSDFSSWASAADWINESALVFTARPTITSFDFPWTWTTSGGAWSVLTDDNIYTSGTNGVYQGIAAAGQENFAIAGDANWDDYIYKAMVKYKTGTKYDASMLFRVTDTNNMYKLAITSDGTTGTLTLKKKVAGTWTNIAASNGNSIVPEKWYSFSIEAIGDSFKISMNGVQKIAAKDTTFSSGKVGFAGYNGSINQFDDAWIARLNLAP